MAVAAERVGDVIRLITGGLNEISPIRIVTYPIFLNSMLVSAAGICSYVELAEGR